MSEKHRQPSNCWTLRDQLFIHRKLLDRYGLLPAAIVSILLQTEYDDEMDGSRPNFPAPFVTHGEHEWLPATDKDIMHVLGCRRRDLQIALTTLQESGELHIEKFGLPCKRHVRLSSPEWLS
jgi:hypothetical protein